MFAVGSIVSACASSKINEEAIDHFVYWGTHADTPENCHVFVVSTLAWTTAETVLRHSVCELHAISISDRDYLLHVQPYDTADTNSTTIVSLYAPDADGVFQLTESRTVGRIRITAPPQWSNEGVVYFSGIVNGHELIYRSMSTDSQIEPYIEYENDGFATAPLLSPNGDFLAYQVWERHSSRDDCFRLTCNYNYSYILEIQTNEQDAIREHTLGFQAGESFFAHCNNIWSPNSQWLSVTIGCAIQSPGSIAIFDAQSRRIQRVINATSPRGILQQYAWTKNNALIMGGTMAEQDDATPEFAGYFNYSPASDSFTTWPELNGRNQFDYDVLRYSEWSTDAQFALGQTQVPPEHGYVNLVINDLLNRQVEPSYFQGADQYVRWLQFSPTDKWFGYVSYMAGQEHESSRVNILSLEGVVEHDSGKIFLDVDGSAWIVGH